MTSQIFLRCVAPYLPDFDQHESYGSNLFCLFSAASLPEVVGKAGILVDPYDVDGMAEAMYQVLTDKKLVGTLVKEGLKQAKKFSWVETAKQTLAVYQKTMAD